MCGHYEVIDGKRVYSRFRVTQPMLPMLPIPDNGEVRPMQQVARLQTDHVLSLIPWGPRALMGQRSAHGVEGDQRAGGDHRKQAVLQAATARAALPHTDECLLRVAGHPGAKVKYRIGRKDGDLFGFAGLYDTWRDADDPKGEELTSRTIITIQPNELVAPIHTPLPVILLPEDEDYWLDLHLTELEEIVSLLRPYPAELMAASRT